MAEKSIRSIAKAISWRATGTVDTIILSYIITGKLNLAFSIGLFEVFTKTALYFFHERLWNKIKFGKIKEPEFYI
jgi:uncharacterized membrane protein